MKFLVAFDGKTVVGTVAALSPAKQFWTGVTMNPAIYCSAIDWDIAPSFAQLTQVVNPLEPESKPPVRIVVPHSSIAFVVVDPDPPTATTSSGAKDLSTTGSIH